MFEIDSVGKYSVQILIFIDWNVSYNPPEEGGGGASGRPGCFGYVYCVALRYMVCHYEYH
jgi:hypothetical protein